MSRKDNNTWLSRFLVVLKKVPSLTQPPEVDLLESKIRTLMPERSILDILCNVEHWLNWTRHFGLMSGSEAKISEPPERLKRYGDYVVNLQNIPQPFEAAINLPPEIFEM